MLKKVEKGNLESIINCMRCFYEKGIITRENYEDVVLFLSIKELKSIFEVVGEIDVLRRNIQESFWWLEKVFQRRLDVRDGELKENKSLINNECANEFYERAKFFLIIRELVKHKERELKELFETKVCYQYL